jgi:hypothetical protein
MLMYRLSFIRLNPRTLRRAVLAVNGLLILLTFAVVFLCGRVGIHSPKDVVAYRALIRGHYHPVWKDLAWRRIRKGDPIESVLKRYPPLRRDDFPPYTELRYNEVGSFDGLAIRAKDGKLIAAGVGSCTWTHLFFDSPGEEEAFNTAYSAYAQQRLLESQAFEIHQVINGGQDVFLARVIDSGGRQYSGMQELREIYGQAYLDSMGLTRPELTVEVTTVLYGDLQVGALLTFSGENCDLAEAGEPEPVFLHVEDMRLLNPQNEARQGYVTAPRKALDWYQSLTPDQVKELENRGLARRGERWGPDEPLIRPSPKAGTKPPRETHPFLRL